MWHDSAVWSPFCYRFTMDGMGRVQKVANMSTGTNLVIYKIGVFRRVGPHMSSFVVSKLANWTIDRRSNVGFAFYDFENAAIKKVAVLIFGIFCTRVFAKGPFRRPLPLRACGPRVLRWKTLARFLSSAPWRVRIPLRWAQTKTVPFRGPFPIQWWAMRDSNPQPCACKAPALTIAPIARAERV